MSIRILLGAAAIALAISAPALSQSPAATIPAQKVNNELRAKLPEEIKTSNKLISVNSGSFPPYEIVTDTRTMTGASADLTDAIGQLLGVTIEHATVSGLSALLSGIKSGRYQFAMGPVGDFKSRQEANDFVDWVQEYVVFAVQKGNPKGIKSLEDACGARIAVQSGGSAEKVIKAQAEKCTGGRQAGAAGAILYRSADIHSGRAIEAGRRLLLVSGAAHVFRAAIQRRARTGRRRQAQRFRRFVPGRVVTKDSPLTEVLLGAVKELMKNGTYAVIMKKWGLENNMISAAGINLAKN